MTTRDAEMARSNQIHDLEREFHAKGVEVVKVVFALLVLLAFNLAAVLCMFLFFYAPADATMPQKATFLGFGLVVLVFDLCMIWGYTIAGLARLKLYLSKR